jgi:hypothetical protein
MGPTDATEAFDESAPGEEVGTWTALASKIPYDAAVFAAGSGDEVLLGGDFG